MILCVGEALIDFVCTDRDRDLKNGDHFEKKAGGAPANVAAAVAKLGGESAFIGALGQDPFGHFLEESLAALNVKTQGIQFCPDIATTMAYVSLTAEGERDFVFARGADIHLNFAGVPEALVKEMSMLHLGGATAFLGGDLERSYQAFFDYAKDHKIPISFDPNYRSAFWATREEVFIEKCLPYMMGADYIKVSLEEGMLFTKEETPEGIANALREITRAKIMITLGEAGIYYYDQQGVIIPSIPVKVVDTTGAGDAFMGGFLYALSKGQSDQEAIAFGAKVGALTCTKLGAIPALPLLTDLD